MARAKPKKWAAESLVSETERKATASPKQQKMAGELTAEMLLMMLPVPGGKKAVKLAKKLSKGKGKAGKVSDKKLLEIYRDGKKYTAIRKAHPRKSKGSGKYAPIGDLDVEYLSMKPAKKKISKKAVGTGAALATTAAVTSPNQLSKRTSGKAKGSSVKKYSSGGGVRKAQY